MDIKTDEERKKDFYFGSDRRKLKGYHTIQRLVEEVEGLSTLTEGEKKRKIKEADEIAKLIESEISREIYMKSIREARKQLEQE